MILTWLRDVLDVWRRRRTPTPVTDDRYPRPVWRVIQPPFDQDRRPPPR